MTSKSFIFCASIPSAVTAFAHDGILSTIQVMTSGPPSPHRVVHCLAARGDECVDKPPRPAAHLQVLVASSPSPFRPPTYDATPSEYAFNCSLCVRCRSPAWSSSESPREDGDFYFLWGSERTGFSQLYLYKYSAGSQTARCLLGGRPIGGGGDWVVERCAQYFQCLQQI